MKGLEIDYETADRITICTLKDHLSYLQEEVRAHEQDGAWMHPEDYHESQTRLIPALKLIIKHFGG
jgi:hypothetical protein